ncbi:MAG: PH domain-containing protein [Chloroflexi bacterium]|nr:PH domain-containing protein [Chloroflexota bacterium]
MAVHGADIIVDKKDQLEKIEEYCLPQETIHAVFDLKGSSTGFIGMTDKRLIYYDKEFLGKKKAVVSIPYSRIVSVSSEDDSGIFVKRGFFASDSLMIQVMGMDNKVFEFRGGDKAHKAHAIIMEYILGE